MNWLLAIALLLGTFEVRFAVEHAPQIPVPISTGPSFALTAVNSVQPDTQFESKALTVKLPNSANPVLSDYNFTLPAGWSCAAYVFIGVDGAGVKCTTYPLPGAITNGPLPIIGLRSGAQCQESTNAFDSGGNPTVIDLYCGNSAPPAPAVK